MNIKWEKHIDFPHKTYRYLFSSKRYLLNFIIEAIRSKFISSKISQKKKKKVRVWMGAHPGSNLKLPFLSCQIWGDWNLTECTWFDCLPSLIPRVHDCSSWHSHKYSYLY